MRTRLYLQKAGNLFVENRLLKFSMVVLALAVACNSLFVYQAVNYQRVILIPPKLTSSIEYSRGRPSDLYIRDMARHIISLSTTYSPATARAQFDELLELYAPEAYPASSESWYSLASQIEETRVSSVFYLERITLTTEENIELHGTTQQFANDMEIQKSPRCYRIRYRLDNGRFYLLQLEEKSGHSHTSKDNHAG